jgi:hypothetical protein
MSRLLRNGAWPAPRLLGLVTCSPISYSDVARNTALVDRPVARAIPSALRTLRTVAEERSLAVLAPKVAAQWHPTKNGNLTPVDIASKTHVKYWWQCGAGIDHEWEASPNGRVGRGSGCPCCSGKKVSVTNSLAMLAPEVAAQWHPIRNGDVTPAEVLSQTGTKYWWQCDAGLKHEWKASPASRVGGRSGCPSCSLRQVSTINSLVTVKPTAAAWWDVDRNDCDPVLVTACSNKKYWFNLPEQGSVQRSPNSFQREDRGRSSRLFPGMLASAAPEVAVQWHPTRNGDVTPADVASRANQKYWWRCDAGSDHEWEASPNMRVGSGTGCPFCSGHKVSLTNSLATLAPEVASQWHPDKNGNVTPANITSQANKKYWWRCDAGSDHEWEASPGNRVGGGTGCPYCSGIMVSVTNSLASLAPEVALQWHPTGNGNVTPADVTSRTNKKYWWRCDAGPDHEWKASPDSRVGSGSGCPSCSRRQLSVTNNAILAKLSYMF